MNLGRPFKAGNKQCKKKERVALATLLTGSIFQSSLRDEPSPLRSDAGHKMTCLKSLGRHATLSSHQRLGA
jgi:hypothetical protein